MSLAAKDPDVAAEYAIDWHGDLVPEARRDTSFVQNAVVRPWISTGFYLECTTAGRTGRHYPPRIPRAAGETLVDGSLVWTVRHPTDVSLVTVQSAVWDVPDGLTKDDQDEDGSFTMITVSGGTDGEDYELTCRMTPTSGEPREKTITIPVRAQ